MKEEHSAAGAGVPPGRRPADGAARPAGSGRDVVLLLGLALALRLGFSWLVYPHLGLQGEPVDGYDEIARNLLSGAGYEMAGGDAAAERLPLLPLFYAAHMALFGDVAWPWQLTQSLLGALTCVIVLRAARTVAGRGGALVAGLFCAVHPALVLFAARPFTETVYTFLLVLLVTGLREGEWPAGRSGLAWGLQMLTRNTALFHVVAFAGLLRHSPRRVLLAGLLAAAVVAPWAGWNLARFGMPHLWSGRGGITLYHGVYISRHAGWGTPLGDLNREAELMLWQDLAARGVAPTAPVGERDRVARQAALRWIGENPVAAAGLWLRNLVLTWYLGRSGASMLAYAVLHGVLLAAAVVGGARLWRGRVEVRPMVVAVGLLAGLYTALHAAIHPGVRYVLPLVPLLAILAAAAVGVEGPRRAAGGE